VEINLHVRTNVRRVLNRGIRYHLAHGQRSNDPRNGRPYTTIRSWSSCACLVGGVWPLIAYTTTRASKESDGESLTRYFEGTSWRLRNRYATLITDGINETLPYMLRSWIYAVPKNQKKWCINIIKYWCSKKIFL